MNVTLSQLRAFERIVRLGSFRAAAQELRLTQPSVSQRIRELEAVLKTPLFIRRGPRVSLTAEGHALIEYATALGAPARWSSGSRPAIR
jgi:DNA-binding transcriptional LysR family regulator